MPNHSHHKQERLVVRSTQASFKERPHHSHESKERREFIKEFKAHIVSILFFVIVATVASFLAAQHFNPDLLGAVRDTSVAAAVGVLGDLFSKI